MLRQRLFLKGFPKGLDLLLLYSLWSESYFTVADEKLSMLWSVKVVHIGVREELLELLCLDYSMHFYNFSQPITDQLMRSLCASYSLIHTVKELELFYLH